MDYIFKDLPAPPYFIYAQGSPFVTLPGQEAAEGFNKDVLMGQLHPTKPNKVNLTLVLNHTKVFPDISIFSTHMSLWQYQLFLCYCHLIWWHDSMDMNDLINYLKSKYYLLKLAVPMQAEGIRIIKGLLKNSSAAQIHTTLTTYQTWIKDNLTTLSNTWNPQLTIQVKEDVLFEEDWTLDYFFGPDILTQEVVWDVMQVFYDDNTLLPLPHA